VACHDVTSSNLSYQLESWICCKVACHNVILLNVCHICNCSYIVKCDPHFFGFIFCYFLDYKIFNYPKLLNCKIWGYANYFKKESTEGRTIWLPHTPFSNLHKYIIHAIIVLPYFIVWSVSRIFSWVGIDRSSPCYIQHCIIRCDTGC
jgi:hypothetical protein